MTDQPIKIVRSARRVRTVTARPLPDGTLEVLAPEHVSDEELAPIVERLRTRLAKRVKPPEADDRELDERAHELNRKYFGGRLRWTSLRYVTNQQRRFGSCTPANGTIRISDRVAKMPPWVRDYVLVHELAHLEQANHSRAFWRLVERYPLTERARGYLIAVGLDDESGAGDEG